jgi:hypothetical protein
MKGGVKENPSAFTVGDFMPATQVSWASKLKDGKTVLYIPLIDCGVFLHFFNTERLMEENTTIHISDILHSEPAEGMEFVKRADQSLLRLSYSKLDEIIRHEFQTEIEDKGFQLVYFSPDWGNWPVQITNDRQLQATIHSLREPGKNTIPLNVSLYTGDFLDAFF